MLARMQLVAALSARLVWLVRLIWMHQQQLHAKLVLLAHSPLRVPPRVMLALSEQLTPTATLPRRAKIALLDTMQRHQLSVVLRAREVKQT